MKALKWILIAAASGLTAACDDPGGYAETPAEAAPPLEAEAPAAEDVAVEAAETSPPEAPPPTLPPESQGSDKSVQPDSETLFY